MCSSRRGEPWLEVMMAIMLTLVGFVTCKDDSHIIASVARGDKIITGTTHSDEAIWILRQVHTKVAPLNIMLGANSGAISRAVHLMLTLGAISRAVHL